MEVFPVKKRILALILCLCLLPLPGCAAMLERGHETVTTHVDYAVTDADSVLRAETYQGHALLCQRAPAGGHHPPV